MPTYTFETEDGQEIEVACSLADVPPLGMTVTLKGDQGTEVRGKRVPDNPVGGRCNDTRTYARSRPKWDPAAKRHAKDGTPIITSKQEREDYMKRSADQGRPIGWD